MRNEIWTWGIIVVGYTAPGVLLGLGLGSFGDVLERWGRASASVG